LRPCHYFLLSLPAPSFDTFITDTRTIDRPTLLEQVIELANRQGQRFLTFIQQRFWRAALQRHAHCIRIELL
jgi:hypothetical protein